MSKRVSDADAMSDGSEAFQDSSASKPSRQSKKPVALSFDQLSNPVALRNDSRPTGDMLGKCYRNPITGKTVLKDTSTKDFGIVDLWERKALYGTPDDLVDDPYVFKIVPLDYRTWFYHYYFGNLGEIAGSSGDNGLLERVLGTKTVDVHRNAGRWSPALCSAPATFFSIFTSDFVTVIASVLITVFNLSVSSLSNNPRSYRFARIYSGFPRLIFFFFILVRMSMRASSGDGGSIALFGFVVILSLLIFDFTFGDFVCFKSLAWHCTFEILSELPRRIFVCRKEGGAFLKIDNGSISEEVTGMAHFEEMVLIAEIRGLIVQLKPMDRQDWLMAWEQLINTGKHVTFMGMDVFCPQKKSLSDVLMHCGAGGSDGAKKALIARLSQSGGEKAGLNRATTMAILSTERGRSKPELLH